MNGLTQLIAQALLLKRFILYIERFAFFAHFTLIANEAALEKNLERVAFSFFADFSFNNNFSF